MKLAQKEKAIELRKKGHSLKEISEVLGVAKSSVSTWVRDVALSKAAKYILLSKIKNGRFVSAERKKTKTSNLNKSLQNSAIEEIADINISYQFKKILCTLLFWCEGNKNYRDGIVFTNSDPKLSRLFIDLFSDTFHIDRNKFSIKLHLHEYHSFKKQRKFWSEALGISPKQFKRPYLKPHTGKRIRDDYPGCASIRYYDNILGRKMLYLAQAFINKGA